MKIKEKKRSAKDDTPVLDAAYFEGHKDVPKQIPVLCDWCQDKRSVVRYQGYCICNKCLLIETGR